MSNSVKGMSADEVPEWHKEVLAKRLAEAEANPGSGVPWREALAAIRSGRIDPRPASN